MEIEYIYQDPKDQERLSKQIKQMQKSDTLGCLIFFLFFFGALFIFLAALPVILTIIGWTILILGICIIYKAYVEDIILKIIEKLKRK
jgi:hypothetical protein